jgi:hypothetical protein
MKPTADYLRLHVARLETQELQVSPLWRRREDLPLFAAAPDSAYANRSPEIEGAQ